MKILSVIPWHLREQLDISPANEGSGNASLVKPCAPASSLREAPYLRARHSASRGEIRRIPNSVRPPMMLWGRDRRKTSADLRTH